MHISAHLLVACASMASANTFLGRFSGEGQCGTVANPKQYSSMGCYARHLKDIDCNTNVVQACAPEGSGWNGEGYADTCGRQVVLISE